MSHLLAMNLFLVLMVGLDCIGVMRPADSQLLSLDVTFIIFLQSFFHQAASTIWQKWPLSFLCCVIYSHWLSWNLPLQPALADDCIELPSFVSYVLGVNVFVNILRFFFNPQCGCGCIPIFHSTRNHLVACVCLCRSRTRMSLVFPVVHLVELCDDLAW